MSSEINKKTSEISGLIRTVVGNLKKRHTTAVIVAAGSSTRMSGNTPKQFIPLCGMPVVAMTIRAYEESECIDDIVLVIRPGDEEQYEEYRKKFCFQKIRAIVHGGNTRQASVMNGICAADEKTAYFAIADAARPLVTADMIRSVCVAAYRFNAASAACPAVDTVKRADSKGFIFDTVERAVAWQAQTPQVFGANLYRAAAYTARDEGFEATDDNSLVEHIGYKVKIVDCGRENIKITTDCDIAIAEAILKHRSSRA